MTRPQDLSSGAPLVRRAVASALTRARYSAFCGLSVAALTMLAPPALAQAAPDAASADAARQQPPVSAGTAPAPQTNSDADEADEAIEEVVVLGRNIPVPMVETAEISSFISPEDLARQGDDTAAVALRRVTGLSLVQGKFVYVRGLGERYSAALLNGSPLPSPEPLQRVVPLDLFPSGVLSNVIVQKTFSAKYPGEFGGGLIDLQTSAVPDAPFFSAAVSLGGNSEGTFKDGLTHYGSEWDFTGFDDGTRDIPGPVREAIATGKRIDSSQFSAAELQRIGRSFVNAPLNLVQRTDSVFPDMGVDLSGGYSFETGFGSVGLIGVAGYDNGWRSRAGKQQEGIVERGTISARTDYAFGSTQNDVGVNGLLGVGVRWGEGNSVSLTNLYVHNTTKETRSRAGNDELVGAFVRDDYSEWIERQLVNTQLAGRHEIGDQWQLQWRGSFARSTRDAPYEKGIRYRRVDGVWLHNASQEQNYTRFSEVDDEVLSGGADLSYTFEASGRQDTVLSVGASYLDNDRSAVSREFRLLALDGGLPLGVQRERVDFLLSDVNIGPGLLTIRETTGADGAAAYEAGLEVRAAYAQLDAEFWPLIRTSFGVRWEDAQQSVAPLSLFVTAMAPAGAPALENSYVLPTATVTWNFYEDMQLRLGASRTIGRPQFRELAPQQYVDTDNDRVYIGNPYLQDTELLNVDARYEWYFEPGEFLTAGLFYKKLDRPIESIVNEAGSTVQQTYINAPEAQLYGFEAEVKKYFDLPIRATWWGEKRVFVNANYTYTDSEVKVGGTDTVFTLGGAGLPSPAATLVRDGSRMQGQSEHIANLQLGIEDAGASTQATLLATYVGERISARGRPGQPDLIQDPGVILDFVLRQGFQAFGQDLTFSLEARNLLDEDYEEFQELGGGRVDLNTYDLGRSVSLGLSVKF